MLHKIRLLCLAENITLAEVERRAGLNPKSIYKWEETMPAADKLLAVAHVLNTTVENLLSEECNGTFKH